MLVQDEYCDLFRKEHACAMDEYLRLSDLFNDVCWYNFETVCRTWKSPWRASTPDSNVKLHGHRYRKWGCGECSTFPIYYQGLVTQAPGLPPELVLHELRDAFDYMVECEQQITAAYDWAPGGVKYEALRRTTSVPTNLSHRRVNE